MGDADVQHVLRFVDHYRLSRQGTSERLISDPPWFAILPANLDTLVPELAGYPTTEPERETFLERAVARRTDELRPVRVIWYAYDHAHRGLDLIIRRLEQLCARPIDPRGDTFLAAARELDDLALLTHPTATQVDRVIDLIRVRGNRAHFLRGAANSWLPELWERGELRSFREPQLGEDGNYYIEAWDAAGFLARSASAEPETALRMILDTKTENWAVISALARASTELPSDLVGRALPAFSAWLEGRFATTSSAAHFLLELTARLVDEQRDDMALELFGLLGRWEIVNGNG